ncbi:MAG: hypothetical protein RLZZ306_2416 [Bacteroidota bacterium]|jgi:hypothetical protein
MDDIQMYIKIIMDKFNYTPTSPHTPPSQHPQTPA